MYEQKNCHLDDERIMFIGKIKLELRDDMDRSNDLARPKKRCHTCV